MNLSELATLRRHYLIEHHEYKLMHWDEFDYKILNNIIYKKRAGRGSNSTYNDCIIMADTETSKKSADIIGHNHVVAWTISIRAFDLNIVTLYGRRPDTFVKCLDQIRSHMKGEDTFIYFHNMSYDWVFLRKFLFCEYGFPEKQLNTKSHYPIYIKFPNGIILKDSLILAQRGLDKWAKDMCVEHQKACGKWDYNKIRSQHENFTPDELEYIEHDTLAGVECIQKTLDVLGKSIYSIPYTATGIPREEVRHRGKRFSAHDRFLHMALSYDQQIKMEKVYHGGYTHANRHYLDTIVGDVSCYDFASSYPFILLSEKMPAEKFSPCHDCSIDYILKSADDFAFSFCLHLIKPRLKDDFTAMPALQYSKCTKIINPVLDNGRILCCEYLEIYLTEMDLKIISEQYIWDKHLCTEVEAAGKQYLPRWFTDYVFELFTDKTKLKGGDPVLYAIAKAKLNSVYGMCVQKPVKPDIEEQYLSGDYEIKSDDNMQEKYEKYLTRQNTVLPYQWGVWVTAYAFYNLFQLGKCCDTWVYSDTDSCYGIGWDKDKIEAYNNTCKEKLKANGYGAVIFNDREYWLGVAEFDGHYSEYITQGAKRYCGRSTEDQELHITVAGVPKKGAKCLDDDITNFRSGFVFAGKDTGKQTHTYFFIDDVYTDSSGCLTGDSIDLSPCDYLLDGESAIDWESIFTEEIEMVVYDEAGV